MKVLGFTEGSSNFSIADPLVVYALSLFRLMETENVNLNELQIPDYSANQAEISAIPPHLKILSEKVAKADLLVIGLTDQGEVDHAAFTNVYAWLSHVSNRSVLAQKPILLLNTALGNATGEVILATAIEKFTLGGSPVWETYSLPNFKAHWDADGNASIRLRISLIRKVNHLMYKKLKIKDDNYFTCGIDPERDPCGDAIEY